MKQMAYIVLAVLGVVGTVLSASQFVMACLFAELGRVFVYLVLMVLCAELAAVLIIKVVKEHKANKT